MQAEKDGRLCRPFPDEVVGLCSESLLSRTVVGFPPVDHRDGLNPDQARNFAHAPALLEQGEAPATPGIRLRFGAGGSHTSTDRLSHPPYFSQHKGQ